MGDRDALHEARAAYARAVKQLVNDLPGTQAEFAKALNFSPSHVSSVLSGSRPATSDFAAAVAKCFPAAAAELDRLYGRLLGLEADELPLVLAELMHAIGDVGQQMPYLLPTQQHLSLSTIYVQQAVSSPAELRWAREESSEDLGWVESARLVSSMAQSFTDVFDQNEHLVIEGAAGMGKSTLVRQLAARHISDLAVLAPTGERLIPLLLPARVLASYVDRPWSQALSTALNDEYRGFLEHDLQPAMLTQGVKGHRWLVLIDALDEVPDATDRDKVVTVIARWMAAPTGNARYLITTRPLGMGETARLVHAGFFELQPFDGEALERFAYQWFGSDKHRQNTDAERFLEQVRLAGLADILEVPLLAAIAAHMHQSAPDSPLPSSCYALYEGYMAKFAEAREQPHSEALSALTERTELAWRVRDERVGLFEHLALSYTSTDAPLLDVAESYLRDRDLVPPRPPAKWSERLATWLCEYGILIRTGGRLRFLHQTFAEHLEATAKAKALPSDFDPTHPQWDEMLRGVALEDDTDTRVILHYMHLGGDADAVVEALQNGTLTHRDRAGYLLTQGVSCSDERLQSYLTDLENACRANAEDIMRRLRRLGTLIARPLVRAWLTRLTQADFATNQIKIVAVDLLREVTADDWSEGQDLVAAVARSDSQLSDRLEAAKVLVKFRGQSRNLAVQVLKELITYGDRYDAIESAGVLAALGAEERKVAADALLVIASSQAPVYIRIYAARELAKLGHTSRERAVAVILTLAGQTTIPVEDRIRAAVTVAEISRPHRSVAASYLLEMCETADTSPDDYADIVQEISTIEPAKRDWAIRELLHLARDPLVDRVKRADCAQALAKSNRQFRPEAAEILAELAGEPDILVRVHYSPGPRQRAAKGLARLGRIYRPQAIRLLAEEASDPVNSAGKRTEVLDTLVGLGAEAYPEAARILKDMLADTSIELAEWISVGKRLANMGMVCRDEVIRVCDTLIADPWVDADRKAHAAVLMASVDPLRRAAVVALLTELRNLALLEFQTDSMIATALCELGARVDAGLIWKELYDRLNLVYEDKEDVITHLLAIETERARAFAELELLATDPMLPGHIRLEAIEAFMDRSGSMSDEIVRALTEILYEGDSAGCDIQLSGAGGKVVNVTRATEYVLSGPQSSWKFERLLFQMLLLGPTEGNRAVSALRSWCMDEDAPTSARIDAIKLLLEKQLCDSGELLHLLKRIIGDDHEQTKDRVAAWRLLILANDHEHSEFIDRLRKKAFGSTENVSDRVRYLGAIATLHRDSRLQAFEDMEKVVNSDGVHPACKVKALQHLSHPANTRRDLLITAARRILHDDSIAKDLRVIAALRLSQHPGPPRRDAIEAVRLMALDTSSEHVERLKACATLSIWGRHALPEGVEALKAIMNDRQADPRFRHDAAAALSMFGVASRKHAVVVLRDIVTDDRTDGWDRHAAAVTLRRLDPDSYETVIPALERVADGADVPAILAAVELVRAEPRRAWTTFSDLVEQAGDPSIPACVRLEAVEGMVQVNRYDLRPVKRALRELAHDSRQHGWQRRMAALRLSTFTLDTRAEAVDALRTILGTAAVWEEVDAAFSIACLDPHQEEAMADFAIARMKDLVVTTTERVHAARVLLRKPLLHRGTANDVLLEVARDLQTDFRHRALAAELLFSQARLRTEALAVLEDMAQGKVYTAVAHAWSTLARLHNRYIARAEAVLTTLAHDSAADLQARRNACCFLLEQDGAPHDAATTALRSIADAATEPLERALANGLLAAKSLAERALAYAELETQAAISSTEDTMEIAVVMQKLDPRHQRRGLDTLHALAAGSDDPLVRLRATEALGGPEGVRFVTDLRPTQLSTYRQFWVRE